ncbi:MAG: hypothetical protein A2Y07_07155 [Planctomycetes bacterium GWF2_50_10]|nr:MAG: hypothetical protein A2Y07_07155 [Planctomycetes bacterium GWF2_50_10]
MGDSSRRSQIHIVLGTHWDREWRHNFEETRQRLISLLDNTLELLESDPSIPAYVLDGQFMPVKEYLEMRPQNRSRITDQIKSGRLLIGPWYSLPDMVVTLGESTIRNLYYGIRRCRQFGHVMNEGMTNTSWGQISQMPQILNSFGIDTYASYHGVPGHLFPIEFWWQAPDGSKVLFVRSPSTTRAAFWLASRKAFAPKPEETETVCPSSPLLENAYRLTDMPTVDSTPLYGDDTKRPADYNRLYEEFAHYLEIIRPECSTPHILMGELIDAQQTPPGIVKMIDELRTRHKKDDIRLSSIPDYFAAVKESVKDLKTFEGEMRFPHKNAFAFRLCNVLATRMYLKQANRFSEHLLTRWTEPFCAFASQAGNYYPAVEIDDAWELMFINHAHDAIGGCSIEDVHSDMINRYNQINNRCRAILHRSLGHISRNLTSGPLTPNQSRLVVFNPLPHKLTDIVEAYVDVPTDIFHGGIKVTDLTGREIPCNIISTSISKSVSLELQLIVCPAVPVRRLHIEFQAKDVPALGYAQYKLESVPPTKPVGSGISASDTRLENEFIRMSVNPNGTIDIFDKEHDQTFTGLHYFQDTGLDRAARNSWYIIPPENDKAFTSLDSKADSRLIYCSPLQAKIKVSYTLRIPRSIDTEKVTVGRMEHFTTYRYADRSNELIDLKIESIFTLRRSARRIDIETTLLNNAMDHRLRVMFPTDIATDVTWADAPFDVVSRPIKKLDPQDWAELRDLGDVQTNPMLTFVDIATKNRSMAMLVTGLPEYDVLEDSRRTFALTLLRSIFHGRLDPETKLPPIHSSQCLGEHTYKYAIYPHQQSWDKAGVYEQAQQHNLSFTAVQCMGPGTGKLPACASFISFDHPGLDISVIKKSHTRDALVIRLVNPYDHRINTKMYLAWQVRSACITDMLEEKVLAHLPCQANNISLQVEPKKILTILIDIE